MTTETIEELTARPRTDTGPLKRDLVCDICEEGVAIIDSEWIGPGGIEETLRCPACKRETTQRLQGCTYSNMDTEALEATIVELYTNDETPMSLQSFERSLDRLHGLGEHAETDQ